MSVEDTYKIGEVATLLNLKTYVLRFWETEFSQIAPLRTEKGQRLYTQQDIELLKRIRFLLHDRGLTIEGARKILSEESNVGERHLSNFLDSPTQPVFFQEEEREEEEQYHSEDLLLETSSEFQNPIRNAKVPEQKNTTLCSEDFSHDSSTSLITFLQEITSELEEVSTILRGFHNPGKFLQ